jgi:hypothetical protein
MMTRRFVLVLSILGTLTACSSSVKTTMQAAPTESIEKFKTMAVIVNATEGGATDAEKFHRVLAGALTTLRRWDFVKANSDVTLTVTIVELTKVSQPMRVLFGAMMGQASIETDVVLTDAAGTVLTQFHVKGKSSGGSIFAGTTDEAFEEAANEIAAVLRRM